MEKTFVRERIEACFIDMSSFMKITPDMLDDTLDNLCLDSLDIVEFVVNIETAFNIKIPNSKLEDVITNRTILHRMFEFFEKIIDEEMSRKSLSELSTEIEKENDV